MGQMRKMVMGAAGVAGMVCAGWGGAGRAFGLGPQDIVIVYNDRSQGSLAVARHYAEARKVPLTHLIGVTCNPAEDISEADYRKLIVPRVLKGLADCGMMPDPKLGSGGIGGGGGVKCIVTTYDVPLRVLAVSPTGSEGAELAEYQKELDGVVGDILSHVQMYESVAPPAATEATQPGAGRATATASAPATGSAPATTQAKPTLQQATQQMQAAAQAALKRMAGLTGKQKDDAIQTFMNVHDYMAGTAGILAVFSVPADAQGPGADASRKRLADLGAQLQEDRKQLQALLPQRDSARIRKEIINIHRRSEGLFGMAQALQETIAYMKPAESASCLDNELALVLADQNYTRERWIPNPKCVDFYQAYQREAAAGRKAPPAVLVCRLDGLTPEAANALVDTALAVEAKGLEGKLYLDARGLRGADAYSTFDADIRKTADWMKAHSTVETILEDTNALLEAKDAPAAALYCGWYSVGTYHDSGQWVKGAVGYHVASFEMMSLRNANENGWVPRLLQHGFAGTAGPTDEPYLHSFAKPSEFFPLLCCGEFTQGEVWEVTCPLLSWRQGFVGDPLYNPFKARPQVKVEDVKGDATLRLAWEILGK